MIEIPLAAIPARAETLPLANEFGVLIEFVVIDEALDRLFEGFALLLADKLVEPSFAAIK
jgi:hypothetical protein